VSVEDRRDYRELMADLDRVLRDEGPQTTRDLKDRFKDWPEWQVTNCLKYLATVKVPGVNMYDPHMVFHPSDPAAPVPEVDKWLRDVFARKADPDGKLLSSVILAENQLGPNYSKDDLKAAYNRTGAVASKVGGRWVRTIQDTRAQAVARGVHRREDDLKSFELMRSSAMLVISTIHNYGPSTVHDLNEFMPETPGLDAEGRAKHIGAVAELLARLAYLNTDDEVRYSFTESGKALARSL
jgi:hypothetical protein